MTKREITSADLDRGRHEANQQLAEAREEHARAAYAHAMDRDDESARQSLIDAKQRIDLLEAELQGLGAAGGEARRRERLASIARRQAELEAVRKACEANGEALKAEFQKAEGAIAAVGEAVKALESAAIAFNRSEQDCIVVDGRPQALHMPAVRIGALVDALLWLAIGDQHDLRRSDAVMTTGGTLTPERPAQMLSHTIEGARFRADSSIGKQVEVLREEAAKLETARV